MTEPLRFERDGLEIELSQLDGRYLVACRGLSDSRSPAEFLNPVIEQLVRAAKGSPVTVDFTGLEYMNSATVTPLLQLVSQLDASGAEVRVLFTDLDWQRSHYQCFLSIARTLRRVTVESRAPVS